MSANFCAVLLAGGKSSRMGRDKALLEIDGMPLWKRQLATLQELQPQEIFISGPPRAEWRDQIVIPDVQSDAGPLAGLISALRRSSTSHLLALAIDLPNMSSRYLRALVNSRSEKIGAVPRGATGFEPLAAIYPTASLSVAEDCLRSGDYSLQKFVDQCGEKELVRPIKIETCDEGLFANLNTPDDLLVLTRDE